MIISGQEAKAKLAILYCDWKGSVLTLNVIADCYHALTNRDSPYFCKEKIKRVFASRIASKDILNVYKHIWKELFLI